MCAYCLSEAGPAHLLDCLAHDAQDLWLRRLDYSAKSCDIVENKPVSMLEIKLSDAEISPTLRYFHKRYGIPAIQLVKNLQLEQVVDGIELRKASSYLSNLEM